VVEQEMPIPHDAMSTPPSPAHTPLITRRSVALFGAIAVLWAALAWFAFEWQMRQRTAASVAEQAEEIRQSVAIISANVSRAFNRLQGMAAVLAAVSDVKAVLTPSRPDAWRSTLEYASRKAAWTTRPDLSALSAQMRVAAADIGVDVIWVMNAGGDCVAASNFAEATSFVGTNYSDRDYFSAALAGRRGRQYAVGRVTKVPGLFFSAPIIVNGRFVGALAVKSDLPKIESAINHPHAFLTDDQGVIILAADPILEMRALPGAAVRRLPPDQRLSRYMRLDFDTYEFASESKPGGLVRVSGSRTPYLASHSTLPEHGVTVHILMPTRNTDSLRGDAIVTFLLLYCSGILLTAVGFGVRVYVLRMRQYRRSMEETNETLTRLNAQLADLATVDPLTCLYNRRCMDESLEREVARAHRKQAPLAVIMIDIDHFKRFNDSFGHAAGDAVLRATGALMKQHIRGASDVVCRYGGEEFLIVMPEAGLGIARERAEALRMAMGALKLSHGGKALGRLTISLGLSMLPQNGTSVAALVSAADAALYDAKKRGRDRLVVSGAALVPVTS
jgi:diguanylate cyclase (GGDEF)-like protein